MSVDKASNRESVLSLVRSIVALELEIPGAELSDNASLRRDYELDSVAAINILFGLETQLGIDLDPALIADVDSIAEIAAYLIASRGS